MTFALTSSKKHDCRLLITHFSFTCLIADQIEQNESLKSELDDIVSGLQGYLEGVKGQSVQHRQDFQMLLQEKEALEEKVRRLEAELSILDTEAQNAKILQKVGGLFTECQNSTKGKESFS